MTQDELRAALEAGPLSRVRKEILDLAATCTRIRTKPSPIESLALGESRIGGLPDVPEGFVWPTWKAEPQSFIAQIKLDDLPDGGLRLPTRGALLFFYTGQQDTWGFDPNDGPSFDVLFVHPDQALKRVEPPPGIPDHGRFSCCSVTLHAELSLPPWENRNVERLRLSEAEADGYFTLLERTIGDDFHQLGGFPDQVQGDMTSELPLVTAGLFTGDPSGWNDPRAEKLKDRWRTWNLLLQVGSDPEPRMMWGDAGYLYFWIEEDALADRSFDRTWMILQCA